VYIIRPCRICSSQSGVYEELNFLGHNAVWFAESHPTFRRNTFRLQVDYTTLYPRRQNSSCKILFRNTAGRREGEWGLVYRVGQFVTPAEYLGAKPLRNIEILVQWPLQRPAALVSHSAGLLAQTGTNLLLPSSSTLFLETGSCIHTRIHPEEASIVYLRNMGNNNAQI
jgi:hypothetical protein